jgi:hypothetical protein
VKVTTHYHTVHKVLLQGLLHIGLVLVQGLHNMAQCAKGYNTSGSVCKVLLQGLHNMAQCAAAGVRHHGAVVVGKVLAARVATHCPKCTRYILFLLSPLPLPVLIVNGGSTRTTTMVETLP